MSIMVGNNMNLTEFLKELSRSGDRVFYHPNGGNAGDALINVGFYHLADKVQLRYVEVDDQKMDYAENDVVLIAGGGCIVPEWPSVSNYIRRLVKTSARIVVLPQSVSRSDEVLALLRQGDMLILREETSYRYCQKLALECQISLSNDTAFYVDKSILELDPGRKVVITGYKDVIRMLLIRYHELRSRLVGKISAYRCDSEASLEGVDRKIINDLSLVCGFGAQNKKVSTASAFNLLKVISRYKLVETDRLHIMVGSLIAGVSVVAHDNNYGKISGVYDYSVDKNQNYDGLVEFRR